MSTTDPTPAAGFDGLDGFDGFETTQLDDAAWRDLKEYEDAQRTYPALAEDQETHDGFDGLDGFDDDGEEEFWPPVAWTPARPLAGPEPMPGPDGLGEELPVVVVGHVSDLLAAGERVRRSDLAPLQDLVGRRAARALRQRLQEDWQAARGARRSGKWWQRWGRLVPLPGSLAELVVRWQDGERLARADRDQLAGVVGQDIARRLLPEVRWGWWW